MLKRRGNFPYDFDAAYPAYPTPVMPQYPAPPPATPPSIPVAAPPAAPLAADAPPDTPQPIPATTLTTQTPEIKPPLPETRSRKPIRRSTHFKPRLKQDSAPPPSESAAAHHPAKCSICNHPDRHAIDDDFVHWVRPSTIAWEFDISARAICRHAHATRLYELRARNYIEALDLVVENAQGATVTGDTIIRAIRVATQFRESGQWTEPPRRVIYSIEREPSPAIAPPEAAPALVASNNNPVWELAPPLAPEGGSIDTHNHLENDLSHCKQS